MPNDVQELDAVETPPRAHGTLHSGLGYTTPTVVPQDENLRRAAEILNSGERVAMLVGAGALRATDEVVETAERLGAGRGQGAAGQGGGPG